MKDIELLKAVINKEKCNGEHLCPGDVCLGCSCQIALDDGKRGIKYFANFLRLVYRDYLIKNKLDE